MAKFSNISEVKEIAQMLDTAAVQWLNSGPPANIQERVTEARELLQHGIELADAPLRIAFVGEFTGGKTLLLNAMLDSTDLFPSLFQPTTGNVLEVRVTLRREERPPEIRSAQISFCNQSEIESILEGFLKDLKSQGVEGLPQKIDLGDLDKFERLLIKQYTEIKAITGKYVIVAALDYIVALHANQELVCRENRFTTNLPMDLIATSLTLPPRPDLNKGIQGVYESFKRTYETKSGSKVTDRITSNNIRCVFPMIRKITVELNAWATPFGIKTEDVGKRLAFLDFPGLGSDVSTARDYFMCMSEIRDAHAIVLVFNGANPGTSGASAMASLFQRAGKLSSERLIVVVNRFDEFHPMPTNRNMQSYYRSEEDGTTVGFCNVQVPAKNLLNLKDFNLYITSALVYLFEEHSERPNWSFGNPNWFNENKRQGCYALYKRCYDDFQKLIQEVEQNSKAPKDHQILKDGLVRYSEKAGVPSLRQDLVQFAMERGEHLIKEDALKEIRAGYRILDEVAPKLKQTDGRPIINPEVTLAAQDFYRVLELAVADTLPGGQSNYKRLRMKGAEDQDLSLWETIEQEIAANVTSWPEWFAILNNQASAQLASKVNQRGTPDKAAGAPQRKGISRYQHLRKQTSEVPTEFKAFDERFHSTAKMLTELTLQGIGQAMVYSLQRFEQHGDYQDAIRNFQGMVMAEKLATMEEAMPIMDVWQPSNMANDEIVPTVLERIKDEVDAIENLSCPYDGSRPCFWNLALIIRVQVQLLKTYRDRLSRLVAAAESQFQNFFCNEVLRANILPLVRSALNNTEFLGQVAMANIAGGGATNSKAWETIGQIMRIAVENAKARDGVPGAIDISKLNQQMTAEGQEGMEGQEGGESQPPSEEEPEEQAEPEPPKATGRPGSKPAAPAVKPGAAKPATTSPAKPGAAPAKPTPVTSPAKPAPLAAAKPTPGAKPATMVPSKPASAPVSEDEPEMPLPGAGKQSKDVPTPPKYNAPELVDDSDESGSSAPQAPGKTKKDDEEEFEEW